MGGHAPMSEDEVHEGSPGSPISIDEGVDRLELRVRDGCLSDSGKRVFVGKGDKIGDEVGDVLRRRRDEGCSTGVVLTAPDPVLLVTERAAVAFRSRLGEETLVDVQHQLHRDRVSRIDVFDSEDHGIDVPEHFDCRDVGRVVAKTSRSLCAQQSARADFQALDAR